MLTFSVLGPLEVRRDGTPVDLGARRHHELLTLLVTRPRSVVSAEALIDALWDGDAPPAATNTIQGYVSRLRRVLEPERSARGAARVLVTHAVGYRLDVGDDAVDVGVFRRRVAAARRLARQDPAAAAREVRAALALWRGPALADVGDAAWAQPVVRALEEERVAAEDLLTDLRLSAHRPDDLDDLDDLVADLRGALSADPLRERTAGYLMRALYRTGRQVEALEVARSTRAVLEETLGIDPGPELRELELAVLRQDDEALVPRPVQPVGAPAAPAGPAPTSPAAPAGARAGGPDATPAATLPGRAAELAAVAGAAATARAGTTAVVLVVGEAGIGKSRLVREATAALDDFRVVVGTCTDLEGQPPYWPWRQVTTALGRGTAGAVIDGSGDQAGGDEGARVPAARFEQALQLAARLRDVAADRPLALVLEDVHWADPPSLQLLELVLGELHDAPVLLLLTTRVAGASSSYALTRVLAALGRHPAAVRLDLEGLDDEAIGACVLDVAGRRPAPDLAAEIGRRSRGNPFFAREVARLIGEDGRLRRGVPDAVRDVVRLRSATLAADARELLLAGAVLGRDFSLATAADVLGRDVDVAVVAAEAAVGAGLLVEPVPGRLRFEHALVHEAMREELSGARAVTIHARAAEALVRREQPPAGVLAHHLLHAQDPRGHAAAVRAAHEDLAQLAVEPALELVEKALALAPAVAVEPAVRRELLLLRGLALLRLGRLDGGWAQLVEVAAEARSAGDVDQLARATLAMAGDGGVSGYWTAMAPVGPHTGVVVDWLRRALERPENLDPATRVALRSALAAQLAVAGTPDLELAEEAAKEAEGLDRRSEARALTARWASLWTPDHAEERLGIASRLLDLAGGEVHHELAARHLLATALLEAGDLAGSDAQAGRLAETARRHRNPDFALQVLWWRSMRALMSGDLAAAEEAAAELASEMGDVTGAAAATATLSRETVAGIVAWERDLLGHAAAQLDVQGFSDHPGMQAVRALAHAGAGHAERAREVLRSAFGSRLERLGADSTAVSPLVLGAEALARAGDDGLAPTLLDRLAPYAGTVIVFAPGAVCMGAGSLYTGSMAALAGDLERARRDLADAVDRNRRLGADPFTMRALSRLAAVEERCGAADAAVGLRREAAEVADRRGLALAPFALDRGGAAPPAVE